jgi:penicillin-binding protein 1A
MIQKTFSPPQNSQPRRPKKKRASRRFILYPLAALFILSLLGGLSLVVGYHYISQDLPKINSLMDYRPPVITTVYADDNRKIAEFFKERRVVVPLSEMPPLLVQAFVAAEDSRFYQHQGVDPFSILRAALKNLEA